MRVGIMTMFERNYNYGAVLQAYALEKYIEQLDYDVEVLRFSDANVNRPFNIKKSNVFLRVFNRIKRLSSIIDLFWCIKDGSYYFIKGSNIDCAYQKTKFNSFIRDYISSSMLYNKDNISTSNNYYDVFICGSDQIWKPECTCDAFFLDFVNEDKIKFSYAASIGTDLLSEEERAYMLPFINKLDGISVREKNAKDLISEFCNKDVQVCVDPTFLLSRREWIQIIDKTRMIKEKYVFAYFLSYNYPLLRDIAKSVKASGYKLVFIANLVGKSGFIDYIADYLLYDIGPLEFLNLIYNADMIYTDSFHGTVFSIIFGKNFLVFDRLVNEGCQMSSRIDNLLRECNALDRFCIREKKADNNFLKIDNNSKKYLDNMEPNIKASKKYLYMHLNGFE